MTASNLYQKQKFLGDDALSLFMNTKQENSKFADVEIDCLNL